MTDNCDNNLDNVVDESFNSMSLKDKFIFTGSLAFGLTLASLFATYDVYEKTKPRVVYQITKVAECCSYLFK